ncbi:MAG: bifunctional tetrahydrofolate synthase/dihydrofolate synthase [Pseudomonadota bacterium]
MLKQKTISRDHPAKSKEEWLAYLETCHPRSIDLGLDRIKHVATRLAILPMNCHIIAVAGTNGKGSCVELTNAILMAAGYRVATYTSPHLLHYNERIRIMGKFVGDATLCNAFEHIEKVRGDTSLTYFEFGTLAALWLFNQVSLDAIILEVGLGGRLDAVNCVEADIAVISMVDFDHMDWLGDTRELIAKEKAGIMRANKPCVFGDFSLPQSVSEQATLLNSTLYSQGQAFDYKKHTSSWSWKSQQHVLDDLPLPRIDLQNAATVLQVIELLGEPFFIPRKAIEKGLQQVFLPGRFQIIQRNSTRIILDVAHNPAGGRCLARRLMKEPPTGKMHAIVGMLANKDIQNTLAPLINLIDHWYLADLEAPNGATADQLRRCLTKIGSESSVFTFSSPILAYRKACQAARKEDCLLVFGSFHTVGVVLKNIDLFE